VLRPNAVVELVWQDESGNTAVTQLNAPSSLTYAEIAADAQSLAAILASLTGAVLIKIRVKYSTAFEAPVPVISGTPITRTGLFFFSTGTTTPDTAISIPAVKDSIVVSTGPTSGIGIDLSNSDVIAFGDDVIANGISNPFADAVVSLFAAYIQSRV